MLRKILTWHVVLQTASLIRRRNAAQSTLVLQAVMHATAEKQNVLVSAVAEKLFDSSKRDTKTGDFVRKSPVFLIAGIMEN